MNSQQAAENGKKVGLIGLGLLGRALARRLAGAGYTVHGYDPDPAAVAAGRLRGVHIEPDPGAVARGCLSLLFALPDSTVRQVLLWGNDGLAAALRPGMLILDTSTGRPEDLLADHERLARQGVRLIDACVAGSSGELEDGKAPILVGSEDDLPQGKALLDALAARVFYLGAPGQGSRAKLVVNLVLGLNRLVLAEGLGLAAKAGFDWTQILEILKAGGSYSRVMDIKGSRMITGDFEPVARLRQHAKDVSLIRQLAEQLGARTPLSELHQRLLEEAMAAGWGDLDNAAVIKLFSQCGEASPKVPLRRGI